MILDYYYDPRQRQLGISYITDNGTRQILNKNVSKFKTYYKTPQGKYTNWDGDKCDIKWTDKPSIFDIKTYLEEMPEENKKLLQGKTPPRLYSFDIEIDIVDDFPEASEAKYPISTISIASPECNVIVLGTKDFNENDKAILQQRFEQYMYSSEFFKGLNLPKPYILYYKFSNEHDMIEYFLKNIVSKVPIMAGWNSIIFDWQYIQNRINGYYPDLSIRMGSCNGTVIFKKYEDMKGNKISLTMPCHTLILDMMDVINTFDTVVMSIKESLSLDYIAYESLKMHKIKYDGDLKKLYEQDYGTYVFYNAIDSILVQLIDKRFKTLLNIYTQALYCREKIGSCFSKIALTEALFFNYFYEHDIKVVPEFNELQDRGTLIGAYVCQPVSAKHNFICCNDFASLYPSVIITCNISVENFVGGFYDNEMLKKYRDKSKYIIVGGVVYENKGTSEKPKLGDLVRTCLDEETLQKYKQDPNFFVSVNGNVYKNDKTYAFKYIQSTLKKNRDKGKYLAKELDAIIITDIDHIIQDKYDDQDREYPSHIIEHIRELGWDVHNKNDIITFKKENLIDTFKKKIKEEIEYLTSFEQAMKYLGNAGYGGSSHEAFFWHNMNLANDITGEARNIIHIMEYQIPYFFKHNWIDAKDLHDTLHVKVDVEKAHKILKEEHNFVKIVYGDTDSLYITYNNVLNSLQDISKMTIEDKISFLVKLNTDFLDEYNRDFMKKYYQSRHAESVHNFELETISLAGCWLDVKKRYAQILAWKDGKTYDLNNMPLKVKGLEVNKSSYSKAAREGLTRLIRYLLETSEEDFLLQKLNIKMQEEKKNFMEADLEDICGNMNVHQYQKYILDDKGDELLVAAKCPFNVKALGNYNHIRNKYNLPGDPIYGGKVKWYCFYPLGIKNPKIPPKYFAFQSRNYPEWANIYAPISRDEMFTRMILDPFNRIISAIGLGMLNIDGSIQLNIF